MIDKRGYRLNVGIMLMNSAGKLFWGRRIKNGWQFPQGGIQDYETIHEAMYRELEEELGLKPANVKVLSVTRKWLYYNLPKHLQRNTKPPCVGQKQKWFLLQLISPDDAICLDASDSPEFDTWQWVEYWNPLHEVISFKRQVYKQALQEFEHLVLKKETC